MKSLHPAKSGQARTLSPSVSGAQIYISPKPQTILRYLISLIHCAAVVSHLRIPSQRRLNTSRETRQMSLVPETIISLELPALLHLREYTTQSRSTCNQLKGDKWRFRTRWYYSVCPLAHSQAKRHLWLAPSGVLQLRIRPRLLHHALIWTSFRSKLHPSFLRAALNTILLISKPQYVY